MVTGVMLAFVFYSHTMLNHDSAWYLIATQRWLHGARLYRDIMEVNPPLAFYLTAPAVWLADHTPISSMHAFFLLVCVLAFVSLAWARRLLCGSTSPRRRNIMTMAAFVGLLIVPAASFGEREHLMVVFSLPYIFASAFKPDITRIERTLLAAYAFLGLALKPYFLLLSLSIGLYEAIRTRRLRAALTIEHLVIALGCVGYLVVIALCYPAYLTLVVPMAHLVYGAFGLSHMHILLVPGFAALLLLGYLLKTAGVVEPRDRQIAGILIVAVGAFVLAYILQFKGWEYQRAPIYSTLCIAVTWVFLILPREHWCDDPVRALSRGLSSMAIGVSTLFPLALGTYRNEAVQRFAAFLPQDPGKSSFVAFSSQVSVAFPLANISHARSTSRYPALWLIPGAIAQLKDSQPLSSSRRFALHQVLDYARRTTVDDVLTGRPDVVFVDARLLKPYFGHASFSYLHFFDQDPRFVKFWRSYYRVGQAGGFEVWQRETSFSHTKTSAR